MNIFFNLVRDNLLYLSYLKKFKNLLYFFKYHKLVKYRLTFQSNFKKSRFLIAIKHVFVDIFYFYVDKYYLYKLWSKFSFKFISKRCYKKTLIIDCNRFSSLFHSQIRKTLKKLTNWVFNTLIYIFLILANCKGKTH